MIISYTVSYHIETILEIIMSLLKIIEVILTFFLTLSVQNKIILITWWLLWATSAEHSSHHDGNKSYFFFLLILGKKISFEFWRHIPSITHKMGTVRHRVQLLPSCWCTCLQSKRFGALFLFVKNIYQAIIVLVWWVA